MLISGSKVTFVFWYQVVSIEYQDPVPFYYHPLSLISISQSISILCT